MGFNRNIRDSRYRVWWRLARSGSEQALQWLYGEMYQPVANYVCQRVGNTQDAEDIVSQVFQRFLQRFDLNTRTNWESLLVGYRNLRSQNRRWLMLLNPWNRAARFAAVGLDCLG